MILFFVVYDNNNFGGHWDIFSLYVSINLMWMLVIGTAGIYSFATVGVVGAGAYLAAYIAGGSPGGSDYRERPVAQRRPHGAGRSGLRRARSGRSSRLRRSACEGCTSPCSRSASPRCCGRSSSSRRRSAGAWASPARPEFLKEDQIATETGRTIHFFIGLALIVFCLIVYRLVSGGRLGLLLRTARESEGVAKALGVDVVRARFAVFIISSAVLGLVGGFYTGYYGSVSLTIFDFNTLLLLLAMIVVGGIGSAKGAIIGTALLLYIDRTYADLDNPAWRFVWIGIIMFGVTLLTTRGLVGVPAQIRDYVQRRRARRTGGEDEPIPTPAELEVPGL